MRALLIAAILRSQTDTSPHVSHAHTCHHWVSSRRLPLTLKYFRTPVYFWRGLLSRQQAPHVVYRPFELTQQDVRCQVDFWMTPSVRLSFGLCLPWSKKCQCLFLGPSERLWGWHLQNTFILAICFSLISKSQKKLKLQPLSLWRAFGGTLDIYPSYLSDMSLITYPNISSPLAFVGCCQNRT